MGDNAIGKRTLLKGAAALALTATLPAEAKHLSRKIARSQFAPNWDSLIDGYRAPDWFRDAKFGIWAHWSAQCVPEQGDWYARRMYLQGDSSYQHHLTNYGHPADVGFMEMYPRWKAQKFDPDALKQLGQSFVEMKVFETAPDLTPLYTEQFLPKK